MAILGNLLKRGIGVTSRIQTIRKIKPYNWQRKTFRKLITKARNTQFGKAYNFDEILESVLFHNDRAFYQKFKKNVPIYDYSKIYADWWHKAREGQSDVCWPGKVKYFALSSGTSEAASKAIPVTKEMVKAIHRTSINQIITLGQYRDLPASLYEKGYLMLGGSTRLNPVDTHYEGDLSGITAAKIPFWFENFYKPGKKIAQEKNWENKLNEITKSAKDWDIGFVAGVPAWIQIIFERIIEEYKLDNIHQIWPNLTAFGWGGVSIEPYKKGFEKLLDPEHPFYFIETYLASEGFLAYQTKPKASLQLVLNNGIFFEFIPFNEKNFDFEGNLVENPETLMIDEVENNTEYALLISTCAGSWRYLIGDTIKFTDKKCAEMIITGRTKHFMSMCGEHLSVDNMNKAIELASEELGITVKEFTLAGVKHPPLFAHQWYVGTDDAVDENVLAKVIDEKIKILNDDYAVERQHALKNVFCKVLPSLVFLDWMESQGKMGGQNKFPRVLKGKTMDSWQEFVSKI